MSRRRAARVPFLLPPTALLSGCAVGSFPPWLGGLAILAVLAVTTAEAAVTQILRLRASAAEPLRTLKIECAYLRRL